MSLPDPSAVNEPPAPTDAAAASAAHDLVQLQGKIEDARAVLVRLLQDVIVAENRLNVSDTARLLEANEELVVAALHAQSDADTAAQALDEVAQTVGRDPLTHLPNRALLLDRLTQAIAGARRHGKRLALLFLDIDHFKQINDSQGHAVGDEVLELVAKRLASAIRAADTVSRYGGDEFVILLDEVSQPSDPVMIAKKVLATIGAPSRVGELLLELSVSIGISLYPDDGDDAGALIAAADAAMYRAKRHGDGCFAFHGQAPVGTPTPETGDPAPAQHAIDLAEHERQHAQLREANEQLLLAVLSARELQAAAEQAQERQAQFMALVADELSNPMMPILATAMLGRALTDEPLLPRLQAIIERQLAQMSLLVAALREVSHAGGSSLRPERQAVDMVAVIDAAAADFQALLDSRDQRLRVERPAAGLDMPGDPTHLAYIVRNLLDNASQYTPRGGEITLSAEVAGDELVITVADSGIGITAQALPQVFEPFVQDTHALDFHGGGLGIGLTVVRALVQAHAGSVVASSAGSGLGSQFVVRLPLAVRSGSQSPVA